MPLSQLLESSDGKLKAELQLILNAVVEGLCGLDAEGNVTFCNDALLKITGYSADELIGSDFHDLLHHSRPDGTKYPAQECAFHQAVIARQAIHVVGEFHWRKNGTCFPTESWTHPLPQPLSRTAFVVTFQDLTESQKDKDALSESEEKFRRILSGTPDVAWTADCKGRTVYISPKAEAVFGYTKREMCAGDATLWLDCIHPEDFGRVKKAYDDLFEKHSAFEQEYRLRHKDGRWIWVCSRAATTHEENGIFCADGVLSDITPRKRAEEELQSSRQMLQSILDAIPQRVFWKDRDSNYLGCNRALAADAGLPGPAAIIGKSDFDLSWQGMAEAYRADDRLVMERGLPKLNFHERLSRPDGSLQWIQTNKVPLQDRNGNVTGVIGTYEDITERKRAEKELHLAQFAMEHISDAIFRVDAQGQIVYVNLEACRSSGRSREEMLALTIPEIDPLYPQEAWTAFWQEIKTRGSMTLETVHEAKDGKVFPVEVTANYLQLEDQEFVLSFVRDITRRNTLENQLRHAQKLESVGQLAAGIAHEINTPTQFVTDNLSFLRDSWQALDGLMKLYRSAIKNAADLLPPDVTSALERAAQDCDLDFIAVEVPRAIDQSLDGARRVAQIVRAMKEFSHPDSADKTAADLNRSIESTITVARNEWKYVAEIATDFDATLPPVMCYPSDINQVILNLLVNAAHAIKEKATEGEMGRITVRTRRRDEFAQIEVTDTGTGVPEAIRTRIFDPFFTTKEVGKGSGQGLALAHTVVVKKHSGKIWFDTEIGRGTTFFIDLPIRPVTPAKEN